MLVIVASVALVSGFLLVGGYFLFRFYMVHRVNSVDIERFYGPYDMPTAVLWEVRNHGDLHFEFGTHGKDWQLDFKCKGRIRLFLWTHTYNMAEFAWQRLAEERQFPIVWRHAVCLTLLSCLAAAKILVWPSADDVAALVGFDSITAEKLTGIKAALEQRDKVHVD